MRVLFFLLLLSAMPIAQYAADPEKSLEMQLLNTSSSSVKQLTIGSDPPILEIASVNLPFNPKGDNNHFGWPVATKTGKTIIVVHRQIPGHNANLSGAADENTTYSMIVRSSDGGQTWSQPYDIRDCMSPEDRNRGGSVPLAHRYKFDAKNNSPLGYKIHLNAIGTTREGAVILVSNHGVFRSEDQGKTWKHLQLAFREDHHSGMFVYVGPRIIDHPQMGLLLFGSHVNYKGNRPGEIIRELAIYQSTNGGHSWKNISVDLPQWCHQAEPNAIFHNDTFFIIARNQTNYHLIQMRWKPGKPVQAKDTNMLSKRAVDTSDIIFNPVTKRFEVVQSNRTNKMTINLFSLSNEDWNTAHWRFESCLFERNGSFKSTADGFHTGGAVLDHQTNQQHVFFYSGFPIGPAGVFRLTRTLDTPLLTTVPK